MKYAPYLCFLSLLLVSCGPDPASIKGNLAAIITAGKYMDVETAYELLSASSREYLSGVVDLAAGKGDELAAVSLGQHHGFPITTLIMYEQSRRLIESDSIARQELTPQLILFSYMLGGHGVFSRVPGKPVEIFAPPKVYGSRAILPVKVPNAVANSSFIANYAFSQENGYWKLDYLSTFGVLEKALAQKMRHSDLLPYDFVVSELDSGAKELEFQYRR